jgi:anti-sigma factor RsiW
MTCQEAIGLLADYLEATLGAEAGGALETHLADCPECAAYLRTYRATLGLVREAGRVEQPPEVRRRLRKFLLDTLPGTRP